MTGDQDQRGAKDRTVGVFDRAAATYDTVGVDFFSAFGRRLVEVAGVVDGDHVLDVGCGSGAVLLPAAAAVAPTGTVLGIDLAPAMVERSRRAVAEAGVDHVQVRIGDAESPEVVPGSFDAVLIGLVIFFLPDPEAALDAYREALRPGGRLALSTFGPEDERFGPVFGALAAHLPPAPDDGPGVPPPRAQDGPFVSAASITAMLEAHGFTNVEHVEEVNDVEFAHAEQWIDWSWSHGMRSLWEMIPTEHHAQARADAVAALEDRRDTDGRLLHRWILRYTRATAG